MTDPVRNIEGLLDDVLWLGGRFLPVARDAVASSTSSPERACLVGKALTSRWGTSTGASVRWNAEFRGMGVPVRQQALAFASASYPSALVHVANADTMRLAFCRTFRFSDHPTHYYRPNENRNLIVARTVPEFVHELWHLFESQNRAIGLVEAEFRRRREADHAPMFTDYAHKRYNGETFTEVGSTAWEAFVGNYATQPDDEHLALVLGILSIKANASTKL